MKLYFFLFLLLFSCTEKSNIIVVKNQSDIGNTIIQEFKSFPNWSYQDFLQKQSYRDTEKEKLNKDLNFELFDGSFNPRAAYREMKNGGKRRLVNWSKIEFKELTKGTSIGRKDIVRITGKNSGDTYVMFEIICFEPEANNTFAFIPLFKFDGSQYELVMMWFDW